MLNCHVLKPVESCIHFKRVKLKNHEEKGHKERNKEKMEIIKTPGL